MDECRCMLQRLCQIRFERVFQDCSDCTLNLQIRDEVEIQMQDKSIVIKKYEPEKDNRCVFCASQENLQQFKGSWICGDCLQELVSK